MSMALTTLDVHAMESAGIDVESARRVSGDLSLHTVQPRERRQSTDNAPTTDTVVATILGSRA